MLLRASRSSESLTKESGLLTSMAGKALKGTARFAKKHWKGLAGTGLVAGMTVPAVAHAAKKSRVSMTPQYTQAQKYGLVPRMRP